MPRKLAILASGLAVAGVLFAPAGARAATLAPVASVAVPGSLAGCYAIQQAKTGKYATDAPDHLWLYFESFSEYTTYCVYDETNVNGTEWVEIEDPTTGDCLSMNTAYLVGGNPEISEEACGDLYAWEAWHLTKVDEDGNHDYAYTVQNGYLYGSFIELPQYLYDNTQEPAIATTLKANDAFFDFWFYPA